MNETPWDPERYPTEIREEIPRYDELQARVVEATGDREARTILELGTGSGQTASLLLALHPQARLLGLDSSPEMLGRSAKGAAGRSGRASLGTARRRSPWGPNSTWSCRR